jgi:hypothetical protein
LTLLGVTPTVYAVPWAVHAAAFWMLVNVAIIWLAIRRIRADRYAPERRSSVRFETDLSGRVDAIETWVRDLSLTGARLEVPAEAAIASPSRLIIDAPGGPPLQITGDVVARWIEGGGATMVGFEFAAGQLHERARLARALFEKATAGSPSPDVVLVPTELRRVSSAA